MVLRVREREQARVLRSKGKSIRDIAESLGVSKGSVSIWVKDTELTPEQQQILAEAEKRGSALGRERICDQWKEYRLRYPKATKKPRWLVRSAENFFHEWTPNMAYVLGYFAADGSMYKNKNGSAYIAFYSADLELVTSIKKIIGIQNAIEVYIKPVPYKTAYVLRLEVRRCMKASSE